VLTREPEVRHRVESSVEGLDEVLRMLRDTTFDSVHAGTVELSWNPPADGQLPVSYTG
jgi:hypothetical protein